MFLFDTNVLSEVIRKRPSAALLERLRAIPPNAQFTCAICVLEMRYGSRSRKDHEYFWTRIEQEVLSRVNVLEIGYRECVYAGDLWASLRATGKEISFPDLLIAATAIANGLTLVTRNVKHFEGIPRLKVENWYETSGF